MSVLLLLSIALQAIGPQFLRRFIDAIRSEQPQSYLTENAAFFLVMVVVGQLIYAWAAYVSAGVGWSATNALRVDLLLHCLRMDMNFYKEHAPGEMIERVDGDVSLLGNFFSQFIVQIVGNALLILVILLFIYLADRARRFDADRLFGVGRVRLAARTRGGCASFSCQPCCRRQSLQLLGRDVVDARRH